MHMLTAGESWVQFHFRHFFLAPFLALLALFLALFQQYRCT